jgi:hypothetical protein
MRWVWVRVIPWILLMLGSPVPAVAASLVAHPGLLRARILFEKPRLVVDALKPTEARLDFQQPLAPAIPCCIGKKGVPDHQEPGEGQAGVPPH